MIIQIDKKENWDGFTGIKKTHNVDLIRFTWDEHVKWMKMARAATEVESPCLSRQIGVVIVDPNTKTLVSCGHNGPPDCTPKCDNPDYLRNVVWPQLKSSERHKVIETIAPELLPVEDHTERCNKFVSFYGNTGMCPRKIAGAVSGERLELCTCAHGETNAIINAHKSVIGCWMFCWCGVCCIECTKLIINSRIDTVVVFDNGFPDYSPYSSRWLFEKSKTNLIIVPQENYK